MGKKEKDILGTISPLYGIATGRGAFGKIADAGGPGLVGLLGSLRDKKKDEGTARQEHSQRQNVCGLLGKQGTVVKGRLYKVSA